jgi:hypothetical protein
MLRNALVLAYACALACCAIAPDFPADAAFVSGQLSAVDARGEVASLQVLPRRPRLSIALRAQPSAPDQGPWLLDGAADAELLRDLQALPLTAAQLSRSVALRQRWDGQRLELEPVTALQPGGTYTFALPRKAAAGQPEPMMVELRVDDSPHAGAALRATFPPAEASAVPRELACAVLSFDGIVRGSARGVWLEDERGLAHPAVSKDVPCDEYDTAAFSCIELRPQAPLAAAGRYVLRTGRELTDDHGATLSELHAPFTTRAQDGQESAPWQGRPCAVDEQALPFGCALLSDTSMTLQLFHNPGLRVVAQLDDQRLALLPTAAAGTARFSELVPEHSYTLQLDTYDASMHNERRTWQLQTPAALPTLAITEVRADPNGPEPAQEYVELWNFGAAAVAMGGLLLSDSPAELGVALPDEPRLEPDAHALLVSDAFDAADARDEAPAAGALLVRMGKTVTRAGLANAGEPLYLRTADGQRISSAPGQPAARAGQCLVRTRVDADRLEDDDAWSLAACTPGR